MSEKGKMHLLAPFLVPVLSQKTVANYVGSLVSVPVQVH